MDFPTILIVVCVAISVMIIVLAGLCIDCMGSSQPRSIRQQNGPRNSSASAQGFTVLRPCLSEPSTFNNRPVQPSLPHSIPSPSILDVRQHSPCPSSEAGSQSDYVNENVNDAVSYEEPPEKTHDDPDYLIVLPDDQIFPTNQPSSLNSEQSYENIQDDVKGDPEYDDDSDSQNYMNVDMAGVSYESHAHVGSYSSDDQGSSDYVNAPVHYNVG